MENTRQVPNNPNYHKLDENWSVVLDLLKTADIFICQRKSQIRSRGQYNSYENQHGKKGFGKSLVNR